MLSTLVVMAALGFIDPAPIGADDAQREYSTTTWRLDVPKGWRLDPEPGSEGDSGTLALANMPGEGAAPKLHARFGPFPMKAGSHASREDLVAHVRAEFAAGQPLGVDVLISATMAEPAEGLRFRFDTPAEDVGPRHHYVFAVPRSDGRWQTIHGWYAGAYSRLAGAMLESLGENVWSPAAAMAESRSYRSSVLGCSMTIPGGWGRCWLMSDRCTPIPEHDVRRRFEMCVGIERGAIAGSRPWGGQGLQPRLVLRVMQEGVSEAGGAAKVLEPYRQADGVDESPFEFADGGVGRRLHNARAPGECLYFRFVGERGFLLEAFGFEDEVAIADEISRTLTVFGPVTTMPTAQPRRFTCPEYSFDYPGTWAVQVSLDDAEAQRSIRRGTIAVAPIRPPSKLAIPDMNKPIQPELNFSVVNLFDVRGEAAGLAAWTPPPKTPVPIIETERVTTNAGVRGERSVTRWDSVSKRGRSFVRRVTWVFPLPDGVRGVMASGMANARDDAAAAEALEAEWEAIVRTLHLSGPDSDAAQELPPLTEP